MNGATKSLKAGSAKSAASFADARITSCDTARAKLTDAGAVIRNRWRSAMQAAKVALAPAPPWPT
jgi:hypothetical protein